MSRTRNVAILKEGGNLHYISNIISEDMVGGRKNEEYLKLSKPLANRILMEMDLGKSVFIPKTLKGKPKVSDLILEDATELEKRKNEEVSRYMRQISDMFIKMSFMDLYQFMVINNRFNSVGAFIHEGNKEEAYMKILNTGDESMIDDLEFYLESMEELDTINKRYRNFKKAIHRINDARTDEELDIIVNNLKSI